MRAYGQTSGTCATMRRRCVSPSPRSSMMTGHGVVAYWCACGITYARHTTPKVSSGCSRMEKPRCSASAPQPHTPRTKTVQNPTKRNSPGCVAHVHVRLRGVLPWCARHAGRGRTMWRACTSSRWVRRARRHRDTPGEDARHPRCSGELCLALSPGGAVAHDRGVRCALLESVHAAPATPLGRTEGGYARVVGVHCLAPHGPINASKGLTSCAPKVPICAPSVMAPRSPLYRSNTTWRGLTIDLERGRA